MFKGNNSLGSLQQNTLQQLQESDFALNNNKPTTKLEINKHFSCLTIFKDKVYLGTRNSKLYIYKISGNQENHEALDLQLQKVITPHCQVVSLVVANQKYFVTVPQSDQDSLISIWQTKNKMLLTALKGHKSQISQVIFTQDNRYLISSSWDCTVRVWTLQNLEKDQPLRIYTGNYPILVLKELNQNVLVFGGDDCYLVFWNWKKNQLIKKEFGHAGSVTYIQIFNQNIFTAGGDNKFKLWQITEPQQQINLQDQKNEIQHQRQKYQVKKLQQQKQQYDSLIFGSLVNNNLLLMDRQGQMFIFNKNKTLTHLKNQFEYNQNITGIDSYGHHLFVTTTKGSLKQFDIRNKAKQGSNSQDSVDFQIVKVNQKIDSSIRGQN